MKHEYKKYCVLVYKLKNVKFKDKTFVEVVIHGMCEICKLEIKTCLEKNSREIKKC